jgi:hypothetical protein
MLRAALREDFESFEWLDCFDWPRRLCACVLGCVYVVVVVLDSSVPVIARWGNTRADQT